MKFTKQQLGGVKRSTPRGSFTVITPDGSLSHGAVGLTEKQMAEAFEVYKQPAKPDMDNLVAGSGVYSYAVIWSDGEVEGSYMYEDAARDTLENENDKVARVWLEVLS